MEKLQALERFGNKIYLFTKKKKKTFEKEELKKNTDAGILSFRRALTHFSRTWKLLAQAKCSNATRYLHWATFCVIAR